MQPRPGWIESLRGSGLLVALLCSLAASTAQGSEAPAPPRPRNEAAAEALGRRIVETAVAGQVEEAFTLANTLRRPADSELAAILATEKRQLLSEQSRHGALRGLKRTDTTHFGETFVRWYYEASFDSGTQHWMLTFRNRPDGYFLNGIVIGRLQ